MRYRIKIEWENEDGRVEGGELGQVEADACLSAADVGIKLAAAKEIVGRLQEFVVTHQLQRHCDAARACPVCHAHRSIKDYRTRRLDTVLGRVVVNGPRFNRCRDCGQQVASSPLTDLLPDRSLPELQHLQAKLAAELPYRRATELLRELLPQTGGLTAVTTRSRTLKIGSAIETELCQEVDNTQPPSEKADHLTVGIDGAFVKARCDPQARRRHFEVLTGRIERERGRGEAFAIVRDLDKRAKAKVQALLRRAGRTADTAITVLSDGEDGLRRMCCKCCLSSRSRCAHIAGSPVNSGFKKIHFV